MAGAKRRERCVRMTENKGKWASRHRKIEKLGCQAAAKIISFPRRWHGGMISANQEAIWGMSVPMIFENVWFLRLRLAIPAGRLRRGLALRFRRW